MIRAMQEYENAISDKDITDEEIIYLYIALRLQPLLNLAYCDKNNLDVLAEFIADSNFEQGYALDHLINAVFNYINAKNMFPTHYILNNDPQALLEDYAEETTI